MTKIYVIGNVQNIDSLIDWEEFWPYYTLGLNIVFFNKKVTTFDYLCTKKIEIY